MRGQPTLKSQVELVFLHPKYDNLLYDMALIRIKPGIDEPEEPDPNDIFSIRLYNSICLPEPDEKSHRDDRVIWLEFAGWGLIKAKYPELPDGEEAQQLQKVEYEYDGGWLCDRNEGWKDFEEKDRKWYYCLLYHEFRDLDITLPPISATVRI